MDEWLSGVVSRKIRDLHYKIGFQGKLYKINIDQIEIRHQKRQEVCSKERKNQHKPNQEPTFYFSYKDTSVSQLGHNTLC